MKMNKMDQLLTLRDAAQQLSLSVRAIYRLINDGSLPQPVKLGRASRLYASDLSEYLERLKSQRG